MDGVKHSLGAVYLIQGLVQNKFSLKCTILCVKFYLLMVFNCQFIPKNFDLLVQKPKF